MQGTNSLKYFSNLRRDDKPSNATLDDWSDDSFLAEVTPKNSSTSRSRLLDTPWPGQEHKPQSLCSTPELQKHQKIDDRPQSKDLPSRTPSKNSSHKSQRVFPTAKIHKSHSNLDISSKSSSNAESLSKSENCYTEHLHKTFQAIKFIRNLPPVDLAQLKQKRVNLPKKSGYRLKKTIIFDLDETLVHCVDDQKSEPEIVLPVFFSPAEAVPVGFNIRPYAREVLKEASKFFEVVVFTAAQKPYADAVLDYLDPSKEMIHHRLYRENCLVIEGVYMKDLRIFHNRRIQDLVIVDNSAYSFGYHLDNGIPIISWHDDVYDKELFNLIHYLKILARCEDVRILNRQYFKLRTFYEDYLVEFKKRSTSPAAQKSPIRRLFNNFA